MAQAKLLIALAIAIFFMGLGSAALFDNYAYYKMDTGTGTVLVDDMTGKYNGTFGGATWNNSGKINNGTQYVAASNQHINTTMNFTTGANTKSVSLWFNWTGTGQQWIFGGGDNGTVGGAFGLYIDDPTLTFYGFSSADMAFTNAGAVTKSVWHHVVLTYNGSLLMGYYDGVNTDNKTVTLATGTRHNLTIGARLVGSVLTQPWTGRIDEVGIWTRNLSSSEVTQLYNSGNGLPFNPQASIDVALISPVNGLISSSLNLTFNSSATISGSGVNLTNATLYIWNQNGSLFNKTTNTKGGTTNTSNWTIAGFSIGSYIWNTQWCGTNNNCTFDPSNRTFTWGFSLGNATYNQNTSTTASETFTINGTKTAQISSISATLWYNGTGYASTVSTSGNEFSITNTLDILAEWLGTNSFFWEINYFGTFGAFSQNSSSYTQTVSNFSIFSCSSPSLTGLTLNFTTYDSDTDLRLNSSFEATIEYYIAGGSGVASETFNFQDLAENKSNWMFCLNSTSNATINAFVSYFSDGYDRRDYIIEDGLIGNFVQNIPLYLALTTDTDVVTVIVKDQNYNAIPGALVSIQEWIVGTNTYKTIGMFTTSSDGEGIINLELFNTWYRAVVSYQGNIVAVTDVQKLADTTWPITVSIGIDNPYSIFGSISHGLAFDNETNITTYSWVDNSGYVQQGCLKIRNQTALGYETISLECVSSVAGTINYQLVGNGNYEVTGTLYLIPAYNVSDVTDVEFIRLGTPELTETVSSHTRVLSFIFIGTSASVGIAAANPIWGALLLLGSIFISGKLGWMNITEAIFWGVFSIIIVLLFRISRR